MWNCWQSVYIRSYLTRWQRIQKCSVSHVTNGIFTHKMILVEYHILWRHISLYAFIHNIEIVLALKENGLKFEMQSNAINWRGYARNHQLCMWFTMKHPFIRSYRTKFQYGIWKGSNAIMRRGGESLKSHLWFWRKKSMILGKTNTQSVLRSISLHLQGLLWYSHIFL